MTEIVSGWYFACTSRIDTAHNGTIGVVQTLGVYGSGKRPKRGYYRARLRDGVPLCVDNGVFGGRYDRDFWRSELDSVEEYRGQIVFVVVPDVVGDAAETIRRFHAEKSFVNFPRAFVSQDGIAEIKNDIPWDDFACLFVGGSDAHKLGIEGGWIMAEAKRRGKWVHVGRVNSASRMRKFWQADSWDGTHLGFYPSDAQKFHAAVLEIRAMKKTGVML